MPALKHVKSIDYARGVPWDFMHLLFENVVKNLVNLWMGNSKDWMLGKRITSFLWPSGKPLVGKQSICERHSIGICSFSGKSGWRLNIFYCRGLGLLVHVSCTHSSTQVVQWQQILQAPLWTCRHHEDMYQVFTITCWHQQAGKAYCNLGSGLWKVCLNH